MLCLIVHILKFYRLFAAYSWRYNDNNSRYSVVTYCIYNYFSVTCGSTRKMYSNATRLTEEMTQETRVKKQRLFRNLGMGAGTIGIPGVNGSIDCTHIRLFSTRFQNIDEIYRNRKGYFSLKVQLKYNWIIVENILIIFIWLQYIFLIT